MQKHSQQFHNIFVHISSFSYGSYNKVLSRIPFIYSRVRVLAEGLCRLGIRHTGLEKLAHAFVLSHPELV